MSYYDDYFNFIFIFINKYLIIHMNDQMLKAFYVPGRIRTSDPFVNSEMLLNQLSYRDFSYTIYGAIFFFFFSAHGENRTLDPQFTRLVLYH